MVDSDLMMDEDLMVDVNSLVDASLIVGANWRSLDHHLVEFSLLHSVLPQSLPLEWSIES